VDADGRRAADSLPARAFQGLSNILAPLHLAINRPEIQSRNKTLELLLFLLLIYPFTEQWGLIGAAWAVTLVYLMSFILNAVVTAGIIPRFGQLLNQGLRAPIVTTAGLASTAWLINTGSREMDRCCASRLPDVRG